MRVVVFSDPTRLAAGAATELQSILASGDSVTFGLAGGSTPRATYEALRGLEVPWDRIHGWMTDERWVSDDDPDSNARMARQALFSHVPAYLHAPDCGPGREAAETAASFEAELRSFMEEPEVVLLGIGSDGHTASLFPGTDALAVDDRDYVENWVPQLGQWRVTATVPFLQRARRLIFLAQGDSKAKTVAGILESGDDLPARIVTEGAGNATWMLDGEAASLLRSTDIEQA